MPARTPTAPKPATPKPAAAKGPTKQQQKEQQDHAQALLKTWLENNATDAEKMRVPIYAEDAKRILGWTEVEGPKAEWHLTDKGGKKIFCLNNQGNRLQPESSYDTTAIDILNRHWAFNGESITIGKNGNVISGQKRLISLVLAEQRRTGAQSAYWAQYWDGPVFIESAVLYNVDDSHETVRTVDNTRPRTIFDCFYTDPQLAKYPTKKRKIIARTLDVACRVLWHRTGMNNDKIYHARQCNSEIVDFKNRHPSIVKAVAHVVEEDGESKRISAPQDGWIGLGAAAALMYLMGTSGANGEAYRSPKPNKEGIRERTEKGLVGAQTNWDKAETFWTVLASSSEKSEDFLKLMLKVRRPVDDPNDKSSGYITKEGSTKERASLLIKAWHVFLSGEKPTPGMFKLKYSDEPNKNTGLWDQTCLAEDPICGGIDMGWNPQGEPPLVPEASTNGTAPTNVEPDGLSEEQQDLAQQIREENVQAAGLVDTGNLD